MRLAIAAPGPKGPKPAKVKVHAAGELFCPASVLVIGNVVIATGRCYLVFILRDSRGTFLAFAAPEAKIPPGQIVRLSTPAGAKVKGRIFYLVPIRTTAVLVPMNSIMIVGVKAEDFGAKFSLTVVGTPASNLTVIFNVAMSMGESFGLQVHDLPAVGGSSSSGRGGSRAIVLGPATASITKTPEAVAS